VLNKDAIRPNAAKQALAKLCLNSMWGKLTERSNRTKSKMITNLHELYRFLATPGIEVMNLLFASEDVVCLSWTFAAEEITLSLRHTNEVIGAYVTQAYAYICIGIWICLQERALYCDTDSVFYIQKESDLH
jgi:hypothetical protein